MEPLPALEVKLHFVGGLIVETLCDEFTTMEDVTTALRSSSTRPGWTQIGDVTFHSQNLVAVEPIYEEDE